MSRTQIKLIGRVELLVDDRQVEVSDMARRLLAFVSLNQRRVARGPLAAAIWPDADEGRARANLRAAMWRFGRVAPAVLRLDDETIALEPAVEVDLVALRRRSLDALASHRIDDALGAHPALLDDLCDDVDEDWVEPERERWRQLRLHVVVLYLASLRAAGRTVEAERLRRRALAGAPGHEGLSASPHPQDTGASRRARDRCHRSVVPPSVTSHRKEPSR